MSAEAKRLESSSSHASADFKGETTHYADVGRENLAEVVPPHESYEGYELWDPAAEWTPQEERKLKWIIDLRLLSMLCVMFLFLQIDRGNIQNALTDNLLKDIGNLSSNAYNNGTTIQLLAFLTAEFPIQLVIKRYGFKNTLPFLMIGWGIVSTFQGFMHNQTGFYITRALIGAFEGGFIPGTILFCTYFYTSGELAVRLGLFWSTLNLARILSALLAAGILKMRGIAGLAGWQWLFFLEGGLTVIMGVVAYFALPQSPVNTKTIFSPRGWFTPKQEIIAINRILRDDPAKGLTGIKEPIRWVDVKDAWSDKSMWLFFFLGLVAYIPASPVQGYLSLTLRKLGFSVFDSNMLTIPSAALQIVLMLGLAYSSDYFQERTFHLFIGELFCLPLLIALETMHGTKAWSRFTLTTLIAGYPYFHPILSAWISENSFSVRKRAITAATYNVIVQMGSVVSSQIFRADDQPYYYRGLKVLISICALSLVAMIAQRFVLQYLNNKKLRVWNGMTPEERAAYQADTAAREKENNKRIDFLYKL